MEISLRHDWSPDEVRAIHDLPLFELIHRALETHRAVFEKNDVQLCSLLSIKTGGCPEDCAYCPQAARYHTGVDAQKVMGYEDVIEKALDAKNGGSTRFCMGAAWRNVRDNSDFDKVVEMVKGVNALGLEVCCTLGMLSE